MKTLILSLILVIIVLPSISYSLSLSEARQLALQNNPYLLAQEQATKSTKAGYWKSLLGLIPSASLNGNYTIYDEAAQVGMNTVEEYRSYGFTVNQPLFNGGSIWLGSRLSSDAYKISRENLKSTRLSTLADVESKYFTVLENKALLEVTRKSLKSSETNLEIAEIKYESGNLSRADLLNLQSEKASKEVSLLQIENLYLISLIDLTNFLQLPEINTLEEIDMTEQQYVLGYLQAIDSAQIDQLLSTLIKAGMEHSPALKISDLAVKSTQKSLLMAAGKFLPSLNLQYSRNWLKYDFEDDYNDSGQLGLFVSLPIFPIFDNGLEVAQANFQLKQSRYEYIAAEDNIELGLKSTVLNLVTAAKTVQSSQLAREYAEETYLQMQERFSSGLISSNELLAAEIMYTSAQNQYVTSIYDYLRARSGLKLQIGIEDENILENYMK
jgi:outer membrane protein TolC